MPPPDLGPAPAGPQQLEELFLRLINVSVALAFIALTVVLFWAGIKYLTSGGEQKAIGQAHLTITWALMGIVFLALAWLILLLISAFTGVPLFNFCIQNFGRC